MKCACCGSDDELRMGFCWDCACAGEERAANRTALQHIGQAISKASRGYWTESRICLSWAKERLTRTGDYAPGGEFEKQYGIRL